MNAKIFLYIVSLIGEVKKFINVYWTILYVNFLCDVVYYNFDSYFFDSRDVKCIVVGDIFFVLKLGRLWKKELYFDYIFD